MCVFLPLHSYWFILVMISFIFLTKKVVSWHNKYNCYAGRMMGKSRRSDWNDLLYCDDHIQDTHSLVLTVLIIFKQKLHLASLWMSKAYHACAFNKILDNIATWAHSHCICAQHCSVLENNSKSLLFCSLCS